MKHLFFVLCLLVASPAAACTNLLVTPGASADGSAMVTYTCDGEFHPTLGYTPAADHPEGSVREIRTWGGQVRGEIPQPAHTWQVVGLMNEKQVAIAETTFDGRLELVNEDGLLHYWDLMQLALERAATAREAVQVITDLVAAHGYRSTGESFSIADPHEVWLLEMIGPGPGGEGALWVARRLPDGVIAAHANKAVLGEIPDQPTEDCLFDPRVVQVAVEKGWWDPDGGEPFRFDEAYCPSTPRNQRYASARVWSLFRRAAPSLQLSPDYHRGVEGAKRYPLWIEPDAKLSLKDVFALMRDHYEGTPFDMTQGLDAGPFHCPVRYRPMGWQIEGQEGDYTWERPISTQQTGFSFVSQSRAWMPDAVGGVYWYGLDDTSTSCWFPLYCSVQAVPEAYTVGSLSAFSWDSAWWVFNFTANYANLRYDAMSAEIRAVQQAIEGDFLALQPAVEKTALALQKSDPDLLRRYLTDYSVAAGERVVRRWRALAEHLVTRYNDGYVQEQPGRAKETGYDQAWLKKVLEARGEDFRLPEKDAAVPESRLID